MLEPSPWKHLGLGLYSRRNIKGVVKKTGVSNFITLAYVSSKKMIDIHLYCYGHDNSKGQAIIQDLKAHLALKNKQLANV